jgi:sensor histidine kinase YesM
MLNKMSKINEIKYQLSDSFDNFNNYISMNSYNSKNLYELDYNKIVDDITSLQINSDLSSRYILRDLINSLYNYNISAEKTMNIYGKQSGINSYYDNYVSTKEILSYSNTYILRLSESVLNYNNSVYSKLKQKEKFIYKILIVYIIMALLISIVYSMFFIKNILEKIQELVDISKKVSKGEFIDYEGKKIYIYELDILSETFSAMITHIKNHIESLKENVYLENKLRDEEMKILKYENALKLSQLKILQSQINPHFLFNTLNCINQTAIKEDAEETELLIKSVSDILRYGLSMMNRNATLEEEIEVVKQYMYIQKSRYEDRVKFKLNINANVQNIKVPGMTLQPFVENAFIHGIEPKEEGGMIKLNIYEQEDLCVVLIEDDGCGIYEETLRKIISDDFQQEHIGHTTGMGIKSVVKRLELLYDRNDLFSIISTKGLGTKIYLRIPIKELTNIC